MLNDGCIFFRALVGAFFSLLVCWINGDGIIVVLSTVYEKIVDVLVDYAETRGIRFDSGKQQQLQ